MSNMRFVLGFAHSKGLIYKLLDLPTALLASGAVLLDALLGEPRHYHPLVGFGYLAQQVETRLYATQRWCGSLAVAVLLIPFMTLAALATRLPYLGDGFDLLLLYFGLGLRSLHDHARPVATALQRGDDTVARRLAGQLVSRDTATLDSANATTESVLENGNDAVFGALFWFVIAGGAGVLMYRLANTLDAMWGYRTERYQQFGWAAARLDDVLNTIPARLTALTYALLGNTRQALYCWRTQAPQWKSPNAGPVMAAGAGALGIQLGGVARYHGVWHRRPILGCGQAASGVDIMRALRLVRYGVWLWLSGLLLLGLLSI